MNTGRQKNKLQLTKQHRINQYLYALDGVIEGKFNPNYATLRWHKNKEVKRK